MVIWCTCETQRPTVKRNTKWREDKNLATVTGTEVTETEKTPEPGKVKEIDNTIKGETPKPEGKPIKIQGETCGHQKCDPLPCSLPCRAWKNWKPETCECTTLNPCTFDCIKWKAAKGTNTAKKAENMNNTAMTPIGTPGEAAEDEKTTGFPKARKTMDTTKVTKNVPKKEEKDDPINNANSRWHCIVCKTSQNSPEQLSTHMIGNH